MVQNLRKKAVSDEFQTEAFRLKTALGFIQEFFLQCHFFGHYKVGYVFQMVVVSILPNVEFGPNDNREDAPHFII